MTGVQTCALPILSEYNRDYTGSGFYLKNNQGSDVYFGKDIQVSPGDLVLWKYNNEHGVENVHSDPNQIGFMRMLFPLEVLGNKA